MASDFYTVKYGGVILYIKILGVGEWGGGGGGGGGGGRGAEG